jgi:uncharacterized delta-60 repeat protein
MTRPLRSLAALALLAAGPAFAQEAGTLDPTFGTGGRATFDPSGVSASNTAAVLALPDGRLVLAGRVGPDAVLLRLTADGALDPTFGTDGVATMDLGGAEDVFADVALLPGGALVAVGGRLDEDHVSTGGALARFTAAGVPDPDFGTGGVVLEDDAQQLVGLALQPDGRLVVVGTGSEVAGAGLFLARYASDGTPDATFGTGGVALIAPERFVVAYDVALAADGGVGAVGVAFSEESFFDSRFFVARVLADGAPDPAFGSGGYVTTDFGSRYDVATGLVVDAEGRTVVSGATIDLFGGSSDLVLARYTAEGTLDPTFDGDGVVRSGAFGPLALASDIALQADGKLVVAGAAGTEAEADFLLARYTPAGDLDDTFGTAGTTTTDFGASDVAYALAFQPGGRLVLVGGTGDADQVQTQIAVARFHNDGLPAAGEAPAGPRAFTLGAPTPNPTDGPATLVLEVKEAGPVRVAVYDALGRQVGVLHDGALGAGAHRLAFDASGLGPGLYVVRAEGPGGSTARRLVRR